MGYSFLIAFLLLIPATAQAYIDPNAGSVVLQVVLGGLAGVAVLAKLLWHRISGCLGSFTRRTRIKPPK